MLKTQTITYFQRPYNIEYQQYMALFPPSLELSEAAEALFLEISHLTSTTSIMVPPRAMRKPLESKTISQILRSHFSQVTWDNIEAHLPQHKELEECFYTLGHLYVPQLCNEETRAYHDIAFTYYRRARHAYCGFRQSDSCSHTKLLFYSLFALASIGLFLLLRLWRIPIGQRGLVQDLSR